ncbi:hypothetical protein Moror_15043 [Moniliophthora roreri MCA 2997]|uniref:F-box domain-containing protein n=1 Tax=Moniliophthora roreri (strain MCA 2997) TaxID=1381753 RepID=V2WSV1_MONRO|nr:hypothetical protein Moror_15043 [Moniliophthora roreri MCA 2997]
MLYALGAVASGTMVFKHLGLLDVLVSLTLYPKMEIKRDQSDVIMPGDEIRQKRRRIAGALQWIKELPNELVCEIFQYLQPRDLLLLARTTYFRSMLIHRSAEFIWKASRWNHGIPDPIPPMSEPAHANLLFDGTCHFCKDGRARDILWFALVRCCKECLVVKFSSEEELYETGIALPSLDDLVPYHDPGRNTKIQKWFICGVRRVYLNSAAKTLLGEYAKSEREGPAALSAFMKRKINERQLVLEQINVCQLWEEQWDAEKKANNQAIRKERADAVIRKLEALGWKEELQFESSRRKLLAHKRVNETKLLTEKIWSNIQAELKSVIAQIQTDRLEEEQLAVKKDRFAYLQKRLLMYEGCLSLNLFMPPAVDIALWYPLRALVESPGHISVEDDINQVLRDASFCDFIANWNTSRFQAAFHALREYRPDAVPNDMFLCTTLFRTAGCNASRVYGFTGIMAHKCHRLHGAKWYSGAPTLSCRIELHIPAIQFTRRVCGMFRINPLTTSFNDMLALNPLIECKTCYSESGIRHFVRWCAQSAQDHRDHYLSPVSSDIVNAISLRESENCQATKRNRESEHHYRCKFCNYRNGLATLRRHLRTFHGSIQLWDVVPLGSLHEVGRSTVVKFNGKVFNLLY